MKPPDKPLFVTRPTLPSLADLERELRDVWQSAWLTNGGAKHQQLEEQLTLALKVPGLSLLNNGTTALLVAIKSLGLTGEVLTTPFTFAATPHTLTWSNVTPVFCDIDETTLTISPQSIAASISPQTTGILGVHVYGMPCHIQEIQALADQHKLRVMYDAAHAFGTEIDGTGVGNFGDITMFSFHATKLFHTCEGGALTFRNRELKTLIDLLRNFGIKNEEEVVLPGINGRMNEIQAVIGLLNLRNLDEERDRRRRLVDVYREQLTGVSGIRIFETPANVTKSYTYFMIRIGPEFPLGRDEAYRRLKEYNINTRRYFYPLCSDYECYRHLPSAQPDNLPVAHRVSREVLCLPLYGELPVQQVERCCEILRGLGR